MKTSPKIYKVAERPEPGATEKKEFAIYDPERFETIKRFLTTKPGTGPEVNINALIDQYRPLSYDLTEVNILVSLQTRLRFINWYNSNVCVKMFMTFERNYLSVDFDGRKTYERQAFLIEHVCRIRELYNRAVMFDNLVIRDVGNFKHLALFFEQIEYFICYNIDQTIPLNLQDIKDKIFYTFYDLCNDIADIADFNDIQKIMDVELIPYIYERGRTSLQPLNQAPGVYTFDLKIVDNETKESLYGNFNTEDWNDLFEPGLDAFLDDPLYYEEYRTDSHLFNPFSRIIDRSGSLEL